MKPQDLDELHGARRTQRGVRDTKGPADAGPFMSRSGSLASLDEATTLS
jgi:hypothetical protein